MGFAMKGHEHVYTPNEKTFFSHIFLAGLGFDTVTRFVHHEVC